MLRAFGHPVATCCDMSGVVGSSLKMVKLFIMQHLWMWHYVVLVWPGSCNNVAPGHAYQFDFQHPTYHNTSQQCCAQQCCDMGCQLNTDSGSWSLFLIKFYFFFNFLFFYVSFSYLFFLFFFFNPNYDFSQFASAVQHFRILRK